MLEPTTPPAAQPDDARRPRPSVADAASPPATPGETAAIRGPGPSGAGRDAPLGSGPAFVLPDLPLAYEDDRVVLLVRDPTTVFTYWDFRPETVRAAFEGLREAKAVLRVWLLADKEPRLFRSYDVVLESRSWWVHGVSPNHDYRVELAAVGEGDEERTIGRPSNVVAVPPDAPSAWIDDRFASIPLEVPLPAASLFALGRAGPDPDRRMHARAFELSGGPQLHEEDLSSSSRAARTGLRFFSGGFDRQR